MPSAIDQLFERRLGSLVNARVPGVLQQGLKGVERESLRVLADGRIAHTPHPAALGSALANDNITTTWNNALYSQNAGSWWNGGNWDVFEVRNGATATTGDLANVKNIGIIAGTNDQAVAQTLVLQLNDAVVDAMVDS